MSGSECSGQECISPVKEGCDECLSPGLSRPKQRIPAQNGCLETRTRGHAVPEAV